MAQTSSPAPAAALRRTAIAAARGSVLTVHSAAGMAVSVDREASRMLRASEGLARAAVARLEQAGRRPVSPPAGGGGGAKKEKKEKKENSKKQALSASGGKGKDKGKGMGSAQMQVDASDHGGHDAPLRATAAAFIPAVDASLVLDDEWADGDVPFGPAAPPPAGRELGCDGPPERPPRDPEPRRLGSRSPRCGDEQQLPESCASPPVAGEIAAIKESVMRPDLRGQFVRLVELEAASGRWVCALRSGDLLRVAPDKLQSLNPAFQRQAEQKFLGAAT